MSSGEFGFNVGCSDQADQMGNLNPGFGTTLRRQARIRACSVSTSTVVATLIHDPRNGTQTTVHSHEVTVASAAPGAPTLAAGSQPAFVGQAVTLTAAAQSLGSVAHYQWQEWSAGSWSDLGATTTSATMDVTSDVASVKFYRVVVEYDFGTTLESSPVAVEWKVVSVSVSASPEFPQSGPAATSTVTLTATAEAPSGAVYQWQKWSSGAWTDLGATTTSATKEVWSETRGTRKFRVVVSHAVVASAESDAVYVTWDEWAIVAEMIGELSAAVASSTAYGTLEVALLNCVERRTGTRPSSLTAVMPQYTGAQRLAADECDERGAVASSTGELPLSPTRTFQSLHELFKTTLASLKNGNSVYAGYLDTPQGRAFSEDIASPRSIKFASTIVTSIVAAPVATTTAGSGTRSPTQPEIPHSRPSISDCLVQVTVPRRKMDMLNCIMLNTDFEEWVALKLRDDDGSEFEALLHQYGLDEGDYRCSDDAVVFGRYVGALSNVREEAVCIRHDVAWNSLQEFDSDPPNSNIERRIDSAWNPRNKFLADAIFLIELTCAGYQGLERIQCFSENPDFWEVVGKLGSTRARHRSKFVVEWNDFAWPITDQDVDHARERPRFIICSDTVPHASNFALTRVGSSYRASWNFEPGCAVGLNDVRFKLKWVEVPRSISFLGVIIDIGPDRARNMDVFPTMSCTSTSTATTCSQDFDDDIVWRVGSYVSLYIYPKDRQGGGLYYPEIPSLPVPSDRSR